MVMLLMMIITDLGSLSDWHWVENTFQFSNLRSMAERALYPIDFFFGSVQ